MTASDASYSSDDMTIDEEFPSDFIIQTQNDEYHVHKNVLCRRSQYFRSMLQHSHTKESRDGKVEIVDLDSTCVKICIDYMYTGNFDFANEQVCHLLRAAIKLRLTKLQYAIEDQLDKAVNALFSAAKRLTTGYISDDVGDNFKIFWQCRGFDMNCVYFYRKNLVMISHQPEFQRENERILRKILESPYVRASEEEKLDVCLRWVGYNLNRKQYLPGLLRLINLKDISSKYWSDLFGADSVFREDLLVILSQSVCANSALPQRSDERSVTKRKDLLVLFGSRGDHIGSYDPSTNQFAKFHDEKFEVSKIFTAVSVGSYIYVLCRDKSVYRLDFSDKTSKWERMQAMICDHGLRPPAAISDGLIYVIGNRSAFHRTKDVERFDPVADQWLKLRDKPDAVSCATLVALDRCIYCIGGWKKKILPRILGFGRSSCCGTRKFYKFIPSSSTWIKLESMKFGRWCCGAVAAEQKIFAVGGLSCDVVTREVESYDVTSGQWTCLSTLPRIIESELRSFGGLYPAVHYINGAILTFDGFIARFDLENNRWYKIENRGSEFSGVYGFAFISN